MPNWCSNTLVLKHEDPTMIKRAEDSFAEGRFFEEFVPNPAGEWDYNWSVANWGTKWDVGHSDGINDVKSNEIVLYFDSAWSPPIAAYDTMLELGFEIEAHYFEGGMMFAGVYDNGSDALYELNNMSADEVRKELPPELDEMFGISEQIYEYELEDQDDVTAWYKEGVVDTGLTPHSKKDKDYE